MRRALEWLGGSCLVYAALAACSGAAASTDIAPEPGAGGSAVATAGQPSSGGVASAEAGKASSSSGAGGLLDPVSPAMAAGGGGGGGSTGAADPVTYSKTDVPCSSKIKVAATQYPAAILTIDPPSVVVAARTIVVVRAADQVDDGAWLVASAGGYVYPDGSKVGTTCSKDTETVTFYVPSR